MLWLSLGENCLPDDILSRHGRKSFSTIYSSGRSNIDYALELERIGYTAMLQKSNLKIGDAWGKRVVRSSLIDSCDPIYDPAHTLGFEFTHHDVMERQKDIASCQRKIDRMGEFRRKQSVVFLYFHRYTKKSQIVALKKKLQRFAAHYESPEAECFVALFYQTIVGEKGERRVETFGIDGNLLEYNFKTEQVWGGRDEDVFWARVDEDLIGEMIADIENYAGIG